MHIRVLTYNIHRAIGVDRRFRPERIVEIISHHDPHLVLLQEVDEGAPRSRGLDLARELARDLKFEHYAVGHNVKLRHGRYGNATLSRFPITKQRNIDLTIGNKKKRGCLYTRLQLNKVNGYFRTMEMFNLHLGLSATERVHQIGRLAHADEFKKLRSRGPCMIGGDFNDWRAQLVPILTYILDFKSATDRAPGSSIRTYPSFSPTGGLDKIFYKGDIRHRQARTCRLALSKVASDHLPLIADFEVH
ncbi:endonuclease [Acidobacteria bacterium Mor1]|nr:endonuclease [Acidobacteria bacterium Mor1]